MMMIHISIGFILLCLCLSGSEARRLTKAPSQDLLNSVSLNDHDENPSETVGGFSPETAAWEEELNMRRRQLYSVPVLKAEDHKISSLPGLAETADFTQYAGHILVDPVRGGNLFYWLFESKEADTSRPLIIWLNGGPGCSSMDGLWLELGPLRYDEARSQVQLNPHSWQQVGNMLFIDQPVGTGLSYTLAKDGYAKNDEMINSHMYTFLNKFLAMYPHYLTSDAEGSLRTTRPIFITGESHAGHYIPSLTKYFLDKNQAVKSSGSGVVVKVGGIALGNPWIDPLNQYNPAPFAHGLGYLTSGQVQRLAEQEDKCKSLLKQGRLNNNICLSLLDNVIDGSSLGAAGKPLMYDIRKFVVSSRSFPPGHEAIERYLNRPEVQIALHAKNFAKAGNSANNNVKYLECADPPYYALSHQDGKGVTDELAYILSNSEIRVLVYMGQFDLICNHIGLEKVLDKLQWSGQDGWLRATPGVWIGGNGNNRKPLGYVRSFRNLQTVVVLEAGHMVPMDQPEAALNMISAFIRGQSIATGDSKVGASVVSGQGNKDNTVLASSLWGDDKVGGVVCPITSSEADGTATSVAGGRTLQFDTALPHTPTVSRQLADMDQFYPVLSHHSIYQEDVIHLRVRLQHTAQGHVHAKNVKQLKTARDKYFLEPFFVRVQPGNLRIDLLDAWFTSAVPNEHHAFHADLILEDVQPGVEYSFNIEKASQIPATTPEDGSKPAQSSNLPFAARRVISIRAGCVHGRFVSCCGHGECHALDKQHPKPSYNNTKSVCVCEPGYTGDHCDHFEVVGHTGGKEEIHAHEKSEHDIGVCASKYFPTSTALIHLQLKKLPAVDASMTSPVAVVRNSVPETVKHPIVRRSGAEVSNVPVDVSSPAITSSSLVINFTEGCSGSCCVYLALGVKEDGSVSNHNNEMWHGVLKDELLATLPSASKLISAVIISHDRKLLYVSLCGDVKVAQDVVLHTASAMQTSSESKFANIHIMTKADEVSSMRTLFHHVYGSKATPNFGESSGHSNHGNRHQTGHSYKSLVDGSNSLTSSNQSKIIVWAISACILFSCILSLSSMLRAYFFLSYSQVMKRLGWTATGSGGTIPMTNNPSKR